MSAQLYPLFLTLKGRNCVVVGGNEMAEGKIRELLAKGLLHEETADTRLRLCVGSR
jgi:hypothetical protein